MSKREPTASAVLNIQELWAKYEDIAMHFNDLLMRLRSQSLAGIAAVSTLVGIFAKTESSDAKVDWMAAAAIFVAMALFWIAIFCLDLFYYNRLLVGAVSAITKLESESAPGNAFSSGINVSTLIESEFRSPALCGKMSHFRGILWFYGIVFVAIIAGVVFSVHMYDSST
jgi:hypothetical protein